jgi:hypothetical protein
MAHSPLSIRQTRAARPTPVTRPSFETRALPSIEIRLHSSSTLFVEHLEKHFASPEAITALHGAHPFTQELAAFTTDRALVRALRCDPTHPEFQAVVASYGRLAAATLDEAAELGWLVEPSPSVTIGLATSGLLAVVERATLRTIFFPGLVSFADDANEPEVRSKRGKPANEANAAAFLNFRRAVQVIRSLPDDRVAGACSQYGALKRVLPPMSQLRREHWESHRARAASAGRSDA